MSAPRSPLDEKKLDLVRGFLREHFPAARTVEAFDFEKTAQRFVVNPNGPNRHTLIVPREAVDDPDLGFLLDEKLLETLQLAGG